ncbi:MAG: hypothetical protein E6K82_25235 [Candidatus Rokuibacteriota bacterium]|nr:MAG: hypothetical protein E6K82_25235 [Candidatus Rokubacteria bacterium]
MKRSLLALAILGLSTGSALAAPGDPRVVEGTLEWPATVSSEPFIVIRGTDGRSYYADIASAQRRTADTMTSGSRVAVLGVEGGRPYELAGIAIGTGDASSLGLTTSSVSSPSASIPSAANAPGPPAEPMWRLDGTVQSVAGTTVTLRTADGRTHTVDVSQLSNKTLRALRAGERVSLFGVPRKDRRLVANGYIQSEQAAAPAASPRSTR